MWTMVVGFLGNAWAKIAAVGAIVGAILLAYFRIRQDGKNAVVNEGLKQDVENAQAVTEITKDIANLPDGDSLKQLRSRWQK